MFEKWLMCAVRVGSADQVAGVTWMNKGAGTGKKCARSVRGEEEAEACSDHMGKR
jgi:hypothetical protein